MYLLGIGLFHQCTPELVLGVGVAIDELVVKRRQTVVDHHVQPLAEAPELEVENPGVALGLLGIPLLLLPVRDDLGVKGRDNLVTCLLWKSNSLLHRVKCEMNIIANGGAGEWGSLNSPPSPGSLLSSLPRLNVSTRGWSCLQTGSTGAAAGSYSKGLLQGSFGPDSGATPPESVQIYTGGREENQAPGT